MFEDESCEAYYDFIGSMNDELDHTELLLFRKYQGHHFCSDYEVRNRKNFNIDSPYVYPKDIKVEVCASRQGSGKAMVTVYRDQGIARLLPSCKSSDAVIEEQVQIATTIVDRRARNTFEDFSFTIKWAGDKYVADTF